MNDQLIRLLRIINLVQIRPGIQRKELADRCETSERNIYRDIDALSAAQIPISSPGRGQGYQYISNFSQYPLDFTEQEALAFSLLPSVLEPYQTLIPSGFESAYEKVMGTHLRERQKRTEIVQHVADIIQLGTPAYREEGQSFLYDIIQAALSQRTIRTVYYSQYRDAETERLIDPYYLVPRDHRFYVIGYCHRAGDMRTFRISRFKEVEVLEDTFDKGDFNLKHYMKNTWSIERGNESIRFKVLFRGDAVRYVKEEEMFLKPRMTSRKDGSLLFEVTVNHEREFLGWISQYGPDAEILEPKRYRDVMRERLEQWKRVYEG
ncbi:helix-turn-helix transcriptional regulator [Paenibacillus sp. strain BS8-2]